jgi:hypothetical protein
MPDSSRELVVLITHGGDHDMARSGQDYQRRRGRDANDPFPT